MTDRRVAYLTDYWTTEDRLRFSDFRRPLFSIVMQAGTPLTVGVFGPWGSGKTSFLQMLKEDVERKRSPFLRAVWFTAWKYDRHEGLWRAFILRVLDALYPREDGDKPWEKRKRIALEGLGSGQRKQVEHLDRLAQSLYGTVEWEELGQWGIAWDEAGREIAKLPAYLLLLSMGAGNAGDVLGINPDMAELLQREAQAQRLERVTSVEQFEASFREVLTEVLGEDGRLIVFVDDLDRCLPEKAVEVLEAIKLFLEVPGTVFVVGMDREVIERGIEARYGTFFPAEGGRRLELPIDGISYLQKIVQIPFHLPPLTVDDVGQYIAALEDGVSSDSRLGDRTREVFSHGLLPNPRQTKRALNIFRLLKEIAEGREMGVAWPLLAKTVLIQTQWPELYRDWRLYPTLVQTLEEEYARRPSSEEEAIVGAAGIRVRGKTKENVVEPDGLLGPYLRERREYALLERMLAFPDRDEGGEGRARARFAGLSREEMAAYVRLAGAVGVEKQMVADVSPDLLTDMLSGDSALLRDAVARLEEREPERDGPEHGAYGEALSQVMRDPKRWARERVRAGDALALVGDPRFREDAWFLLDEPLLGFVRIPEGPFLMGDGEDQDEVDLSTYYIARYPVTVAQFQAFATATGRRFKRERLRARDNHPMSEVDLDNAVAYCEWLTRKLREWTGTPAPLADLLCDEGFRVTLPSEAEWEKAARGRHGRQFPWGKESDANRANCTETGIGRTSAVGCFPGGASPYGVEDLSGNTWEWTRSLHAHYPYEAEDGWENLSAGREAFRVVRGGSFYDSAVVVRCAARDRVVTKDRFRDLGFRVVVAPFSPTSDT